MDKIEMRTKIVDIVKDYAEGNYHLDITEENLKIAAERIVKLFATPVVVVPKGTLCKCGKQYEAYNILEGTIVCTLCGKDRLE